MGFRYGALFDMDGVVVDNADFHIIAFEEWSKEKNVPFDKAYFEENLFGKQNRDIFRYLLGRELEAEELRIEDEHKEELYRKSYANHIKPVRGLIEFLKDLKTKGFGLAIATSGPPKNVRLVLDGVGADDLFDAIVTSFDITKGKPDPQVFLVAAQKLGLPPEQCAVFEDSPAGARAATTSGAVLVGVSTGHPQLEGASAMISDFTQITADQVAKLIESHTISPTR